MAQLRGLVLFDFDYTLADSSQGIVECVNYALRAMGLGEAHGTAIQKLVGRSLPEMLVGLRGEETAHRGQEFWDLFMVRADQVMTGLTEFFPWVPDALACLETEGFDLGIVSTKYRYRIHEALVRDGLEEHFAVVVGAEDVDELKPSPEGIFKAMERTGQTPRGTVYVGDSVVDGETAQRGNIPFIGVLSGRTGREALARYPSLSILESVAGLPGFLRDQPERDQRDSALGS